MARNEEKQAGRLNRLWLERLDEEKLKKNPTRPDYRGSLKTAGEVKKWIPSIKKEINFYLQQSQVTCYPERKLSEFTSKIETLSREYKAYLRKYRELEPNDGNVPWKDKPYSRKHKKEDTSLGDPLAKSRKSDFVPLKTPVLEEEDKYEGMYGYTHDLSDNIDGHDELSVVNTWTSEVMVNGSTGTVQQPPDSKSRNQIVCLSEHQQDEYFRNIGSFCRFCGNEIKKETCETNSDSGIQDVNSDTHVCSVSQSSSCSKVDKEPVCSICSRYTDTSKPTSQIRDLPLQFNYFKMKGLPNSNIETVNITDTEAEYFHPSLSCDSEAETERTEHKTKRTTGKPCEKLGDKSLRFSSSGDDGNCKCSDENTSVRNQENTTIAGQESITVDLQHNTANILNLPYSDSSCDSDDE